MESRPKAVAPINIEHSIKIPIVLRVSLGVSLSLFLTLFSSLSLSLSTSRTLPTLNSIQAPIPMYAMCIILYNKPSYKIFGYRFLRLLFFIYYHLTFRSIVILKRCHCWQLLLLLFGLANVVYVRNVPVLKFSIRRVSLLKHIQSTHTHTQSALTIWMLKCQYVHEFAKKCVRLPYFKQTACLNRQADTKSETVILIQTKKQFDLLIYLLRRIKL